MNAATLSGGSVRLRSGVQIPANFVPASTAGNLARPLGAEERGGVWCVVDQGGAVLAPCANETTARAHAATLSRLSSLFRQ